MSDKSKLDKLDPAALAEVWKIVAAEIKAMEMARAKKRKVTEAERDAWKSVAELVKKIAELAKKEAELAALSHFGGE